MPFKIQRVPQGLNQLLSIFGGQTPTDLEDRVQSTIELLQMYGLQQRRVLLANNAALASGGSIDLRSSLANVDATERWAVLFHAQAGAIKVAGTTDMSLTIQLNRGGTGAPFSQTIATANSAQLGNYGAAALGPVGLTYVAPYPLILPPTWNINATLQNLSGVANANVTIIAEVGILG